MENRCDFVISREVFNEPLVACVSLNEFNLSRQKLSSSGGQVVEYSDGIPGLKEAIDNMAANISRTASD